MVDVNRMMVLNPLESWIPYLILGLVHFLHQCWILQLQEIVLGI
jgi:hypothetical protein